MPVNSATATTTIQYQSRGYYMHPTANIQSNRLNDTIGRLSVAFNMILLK